VRKALLLLTAVILVFVLVSCTTMPENAAAVEAGDKQTAQAGQNREDDKKSEKPQIILEEKAAVNNSEASDIFAVQNTNGADAGFSRLIELMNRQGLRFYKTASHADGLIAKDDTVLLKINCQWSERGGTNTDLVKAVVQAIIEHPEGFEGEIIIADNGQAQYGPAGRGGSVDWPKSNAIDTSQSIKKVAEGYSKDYRVSARTWDAITEIEVKEYREGDYEDGFVVSKEEESTGIQISYPKFRTPYGTCISFKEGIWDEKQKKYDSERLKIINMPVLKSHTNYYVTASVKNYMGTTSDKLTGHRAHNSIGLGGMGTQMAETRMPTLNILDAIWINPHPMRGPYTSYRDALETKVIAASTDPAALDYWAAKYILMEAAGQLGYNKYESMDPEGKEPGTFGHWLEKSAEELRRKGFKANVDEECINVYVDNLQ